MFVHCNITGFRSGWKSWKSPTCNTFDKLNLSSTDTGTLPLRKEGAPGRVPAPPPIVVYTRSKTPAAPMPVPMHMVIKP
jgi:hypothetical protein